MARRKSHTPKYGEKVLRQVHSDLATVLKDADSLLKHLDHPQVHNAMVKELQQIVKAIDRIEFMAKKAYPGADKFDPFAEEEGAEQQQEQMDENGLLMDQDPNSENELEEEELHPELTSPEGNVQIGQPIATYSPLQTAEAAAIQGDAHLMGDRGSIPAATDDVRASKQPSPEEVIQGMQLGMGPNGMSNKLPGEKGFDINQLSPQDAQDMLDYLDGGYGSADLLDGPGRRSVLPVEKRDGDIPNVSGKAVSRAGLEHAKDKVRRDIVSARNAGVTLNEDNYPEQVSRLFGHAVTHDDVHDIRHPSVLPRDEHGYINYGHIRSPHGLTAPEDVEDTRQALIREVPNLLDEDIHERLKQDDPSANRELRSPHPDHIVGLASSVYDADAGDAYGPLHDAMEEHGGYQGHLNYINEAGNERERRGRLRGVAGGILHEHSNFLSGNMGSTKPFRTNHPRKNMNGVGEKAIVRMVQVKEHMRKMPNRKKLKSMTCPGCGGQGETCSCDQQPELQQEQQIQEGIDRNNIPDFPPAVQEAMEWLGHMQGRDFNLNEEEQQKAYHYYKTLEDFSKSWKRNLLAGTTGAVVALNANNILGNPYDHFMNNASTAIRRTINNTISAPAQPTKPNEKPTDSKSHAFHKEVVDGHPSAQRGHGQYLEEVYDVMKRRAPQKAMSQSCAENMLEEGNYSTPKQRRYLGAVASGENTKQMGSMGTDGTDTMAGPASGDMSGTEMGSTGAMSLEDMTKYLLKMVG